MPGSLPNLKHNDSSLSLRSKKVDDERALGDNLASTAEFRDNDRLLSEVIEMGTDPSSDNWSDIASKRKERPNCAKNYTPHFLGVIILIIIFSAVYRWFISELDQVPFRKRSHYYNGTDYFDSTVIYISLDGFRNDYLNRKVTPNIQRLAEQGISAEYMRPSFPSITFPNHWTLATGLYPEAHGIVANEFYDPILKEEFIHKEESISRQSKWWGGEPIWITSKNQGKKSGVIMWPGANVLINSVSPDYNVAYTRATTAIDKIDLALGWLDLPSKDRPQSISIYIPQIDQKGHGGGPEGSQLNGVLTDMDNAIGHLITGLAERNLDSHVHLVIVSDHGMAQTDKSRLIFYDKIISKESESFLRKREAWPLLGLRPKDDAPDYALDQIYTEIYQYTQQNESPHFQVYKRQDIPHRFHYNSTEKIAPIIMIPDVGYSIIRSTDFDPSSGKAYRPMGIHGYDNMAFEMRAIFVAKGPSIRKEYKTGSVVEPFFNVEIYRFLTRLLDLNPAPNNSTLNGIFKVGT